MKIFRLTIALLQRINPLAAAGSICGLTIVAMMALSSVTLGRMLNGLPLWLSITCVLIFLNLAVALPLLAVTVTAVSYAKAHLGLNRLVYTFAALILLFANWYFLTLVFDDRGPIACPDWTMVCPANNDIPLAGANPAWVYVRTDGGGRRMTWQMLMLAYVDCFHYSVVTGSTVGFGDIHASRWYTKLMTDAQILLSLGLTVVAIGRHFGSKPTPSA